MLQAADAIDSSKPAGLAKTAEKQGSSKVRNPNEALLTAPVLINLDVEHMESEIFVAFRGRLKKLFFTGKLRNIFTICHYRWALWRGKVKAQARQAQLRPPSNLALKRYFIWREIKQFMICFKFQVPAKKPRGDVGSLQAVSPEEDSSKSPGEKF